VRNELLNILIFFSLDPTEVTRLYKSIADEAQIATLTQNSTPTRAVGIFKRYFSLKCFCSIQVERTHHLCLQKVMDLSIGKKCCQFPEK
jgi:hypothetical protein